MNKKSLMAVFNNAKEEDLKYVGVRIKVEGSSGPEIIISPKENFDAKLDYYMAAYDDDLTLIATKGKMETRITGVAQGNTFEDIEYQLTSVGFGWKKPISDAIDKSYNKMIADTPPESEEQKLHCEIVKEAVKGMFLNERRSAAEARFIFDNIDKYEEIFDICMNGDEMQFRKGLMELQRMQNKHILKEESSK